MRTPAPQLLPIFRSEGQARLLARVYLQPDRPATVAHIARELELDDGGLTREADRLEEAGLLRSERVGRSRTLLPNEESPYFEDLYNLLLKAFGPAVFVSPALAGIEGIELAYIFGSWAARYSGEPGAAPGDIDVLVVGSPDRTVMYRAAMALTDVLHREVNPTIVSTERWDKGEDGFIRDVKSSPLVALDLTVDE
jgi:predicted nucleotidyltransferase